MKTLLKILLFVALCAGLTACETPTATATLAPGETPPVLATPDEATPAPTVEPTATASPLPGGALFVLPSADAQPYAHLAAAWQADATALGLVVERREALSAADLAPNVRLAWLAPGVVDAAGLAALAAAAPETHFVVYDVAGASAAANVTLAISPTPDQPAFLGGYIAAMLTADWRVGALAAADTAQGAAEHQGFVNGAVFFCGLCNPFYGPIVDYPVYATAASAASAAEWQAAAQTLLDQAVTTIYIAQGVPLADLLPFLEQQEVLVLAGQPAPDPLPGRWVVSLLPDDAELRRLLPELLAGRAGEAHILALKLENVNEAFFGLGRQRVALSVRDDLQAGFIGTGVQP